MLARLDASDAAFISGHLVLETRQTCWRKVHDEYARRLRHILEGDGLTARAFVNINIRHRDTA